MEYSTVEDAGRYLYDHPLVWMEPTAQVHPAPGPTTPYPGRSSCNTAIPHAVAYQHPPAECNSLKNSVSV